MNFRPTMTMPLGPISIQKIRCLIMRTTWMPNHVIVQFLQTGAASHQITQKETTILLETVSIKAALCLSDQIIQQNVQMSSLEDFANVKPHYRWEIQGEWNR